MNHRISMLAAAAWLCVGPLAAHAQDGPSWKFSGFGTVDLVHSTERKADYVASLAQPDGVGATSAWSLGIDSKLGAQVDAQFSPQWSASVQALTRHQWDKSYTPELSLGFVKWATSAGVDLRLGRMPYAAFVVSDYRNIGYSQPWVRPPLEVYSLSLDHVDGLDATWRTSVGDLGLKLQALAGRTKQELAVGTVTGRRIVGGNLTADMGAVTARVSMLHIGELSVSSPTLNGVFGLVRNGVPAGMLFAGSPAIPANPSEADAYEYKNRPSDYISLGLGYDPGDWFVTSEYGHVQRVSFGAAAREFYVTGGVRLGTWTPYVNVAQLRHTGKLTSTSPLLQAVIDGSNATDQKSASLGLRWDFAKSADAKLQLDRMSNGPGSKGLLIDPRAGFVAGRRYSVLSLAVDFVF
ncbi:MAG: hypothetical protein ACJ8GJ_12820 [Vitreoscilla sp.]